jgi:hypothetical protein
VANDDNRIAIDATPAGPTSWPSAARYCRDVSIELGSGQPADDIRSLNPGPRGST